MNVLLKKRISRYLTVIATITFMTACSTTVTVTAPEDIPPALFSELEADSTYYLNKDTQLGNDKNLIWQFLAIQALIKERKFVMADAVIDSLRAKMLTAEQSATLGLLIADNFYAQNKLPETQSALTDADYHLLSQESLTHYLKLQAFVHIRNELPLKASNSLLLLAPRLLIDAEKQAYNDLLLAQLILLPAEMLTPVEVIEENKDDEQNKDVEQLEEVSTEVAITQNMPTPDTSITDVPVVAENTLQIEPSFKAGWYSLASLYQKNRMRPNRLTRALNDWKNNYPEHAALQFMPLVLTDIVAFSPYVPDNIAVLLPLSGRFEKQGKAIQLGLLNAYYHQQNELKDKHVPKLHFFDTQVSSGEPLVLQLKEANIDFVVGPLMKSEMKKIMPLLEDMPVLALNSFAEKELAAEAKEETLNLPVTEEALDITAEEDKLVAETNNISTEKIDPFIAENNSIAWHYAFPLSPEDEAKQAAIMMHASQHQTPLIMVPKSDYGERVANAFREQWALLTPESDVQVEAHYFQSKAQLANFIDDALHTDKSKRRINQIKAITGIPLTTEVRSRRDVDAIYIVSKRDELILLKPFIDVSVSPFAQKIPLYASSRSHSYDRNNTQNKELSRLVFSDSPFLLAPESALNKEVLQAWKKQSFATLRMFALGFDSYQLIDRLIYLQSTDDAVYKGLVGELSLDSDNSINAKLSWAKYQNGVIFEVTSPLSAE